MKHSFGVLIFASLLFSSCNDRTGASISSESITDLSRMDRVEIKEQKRISVDSVIEKIDYVKLGDTGDVLIGKVTHLWVTPDHIVVGDARQAKAVFIFDRDGNPQAVINRLGRGPQEYQGITDIDISPDQQKIVILDGWGDKLITYDMNGVFLGEKPFSLFTQSVKWLDDETLLIALLGGKDPGLASYPNQEDLLLFMDSTLQLKYSAFPNRFDSDIFNYGPLVVKRFDDRVLVSVPYSDTIYQYTPQGIQPRYKLDMEDVNGVANFGKDMTNEKLDKITSNHTSFPHIYVESDDFVLFFLSKNKIMFPVLYDKKKKQTHNIELKSYTALGMELMSAEFSSKNQFVSAVPAFQFLTFCPDVPGVELRNEIKEGLTDEDNPVLLFYTLKDPE